MSVTLDDYDLDVETRKISVGDTSRVHANEFDPSGLIQKVNSLVPAINGETSGGASLVDRTTIGKPVSPTLLKLQGDLSDYQQTLARAEKVPEKFEFPHLAWEAVKVGLAQENFINSKLNRHIDEIQNSQADITLLLDLHAELGKAKEDSTEFSEKANGILEKLKARGIDLKGTAGDVKRLAGSQESRLRSEIQIKFTTKVQYLMQQIESMNQILQNIIRNDAKLKEKANQLPR